MRKLPKKQGKTLSQRRRRGDLTALLLVLGAAVGCVAGLRQVDGRIRGVTLSQAPPLLETRLAHPREYQVTFLGKEYRLDLTPLDRMREGAAGILRTPPAPVRLFYQGVERLWRP